MYCDRAEADDLNTFISVDRAEALLRAELLDRRIASGGEGGPLAGVAVALKDLIDQKGLVNTAGSSIYRAKADTSATVVRRLEEAGAIVFGRTNLHEFAFGFSSENHWFGPVLNPWDTSLSPGGSSGGSGVAAAAGLCSVAIGTDTGGSVRVPAALCGIVGLKVTHGRIPLTGVFPLAPSLDTVGPMTRTVADAAAVYAAIAGHDPADEYSVVEPVKQPELPVAGTVGVLTPWTESPTDPDQQAGFERGLAGLRRLGFAVREIEDEFLAPPGKLNEAAYSEIAVVHRRWFPSRADEYGPETADRLSDAMAVTVAAGVDGRRWRERLREAFFDVFREVDFLVTPAVASATKPIGQDRITVAGVEMNYRRALSTYSALVNHAGLPAIVLPVPTDGRPTSFQVIGPEWSEHRLLGLGMALEEEGVVGFTRPTPYSPPARGRG